MNATTLISNLETLLEQYHAANTQPLTYTQRKSYYADIHKYARACKLEGEAYRAVLTSVTGKSSCKDLTDVELKKASRFFSELERTMNPVSDEMALEVLA